MQTCRMPWSARCQWRMDPERELADHIVHESHRAFLVVASVHTERTYARRVVDHRVLEAPYHTSVFTLEFQERYVTLNMMPWNLFRIPVSVYGSAPESTGETVQPVSPEDAIHRRITDRAPVIALHVPDDAYGAAMVQAAYPSDESGVQASCQPGSGLRLPGNAASRRRTGSGAYHVALSTSGDSAKHGCINAGFVHCGA